MPVTISWSLQGQELNSGPSITTNMLGQRTSMLTIASVSYQHIGKYTCRATNPAGSTTSEADLKVNGNSWSHMEGTENIQLLVCINIAFILAPPSIVPFTFGRPVIDSGDFAQLICVVSSGDMPISITWSLKGQELNSGPDITTTMLGQRTSMLTIASVSYLHIGEYTCRATNPAGSVTHSTMLSVNGNHLSQGRHWKYFYL